MWSISSHPGTLSTFPRERLDHGILVTFPHRFETKTEFESESESESEAMFVTVAGVCPGREVGRVVCVDDFPDC